MQAFLTNRLYSNAEALKSSLNAEALKSAKVLKSSNAWGFPVRVGEMAMRHGIGGRGGQQKCKRNPGPSG